MYLKAVRFHGEVRLFNWMRDDERKLTPDYKDAWMEGPAAENAYEEDDVVDLGDGRSVSMNDLGRGWNRRMGYVDESARILISAPELARELKVDPKVFRAWLRDEWRAGNKILAGHVHGHRWIFNKRDAGLLKVQYRKHIGRNEDLD